MIFLQIIFVILAIHYLYFLLKILSGLKKLKVNTKEKITDEIISVIIPFRNEEENILKNLKSIEELNYPEEKYEVIYVDDFSSDNSFVKLKSEVKKKNIKILSVPKNHSDKAHKKRAIEYGFKNSKGTIIASTDADCIVPKNWLKKIASYFDDETAFVSAPVDFKDEETLFEQYQKLEFRSLIIVGAGLIGAGRPTICNAANLAYRKSSFNEVKGHSSNLNISSGDDEFLMQKISNETNYKIKFAADPEAVVATSANSSMKNFYDQRKRWASKGLFYQSKFLVFQLILIYLFYLSLPVGFVLGVLGYKIFLSIFALSLLLKLSVEYLILKNGSENIFGKYSLKLFIPSQLFHLFYILFFGAAGVFGNYEWKGRKVKR